METEEVKHNVHLKDFLRVEL